MKLSWLHLNTVINLSDSCAVLHMNLSSSSTLHRNLGLYKTQKHFHPPCQQQKTKLHYLPFFLQVGQICRSQIGLSVYWVSSSLHTHTQKVKNISLARENLFHRNLSDFILLEQHRNYFKNVKCNKCFF